MKQVAELKQKRNYQFRKYGIMNYVGSYYCEKLCTEFHYFRRESGKLIDLTLEEVGEFLIGNSPFFDCFPSTKPKRNIPPN